MKTKELAGMVQGVFTGVLLCASSYAQTGVTSNAVANQSAGGSISKVYDITHSFSATSNPNGAWSYGWKSNVTGVFTLLPAFGTVTHENGVPVQLWELASGVVHPLVVYNATTETSIHDSGQGVYPPGTLYFTAGWDGTPQNFGVIRFTVPAGEGGKYRLESAVRCYLDGDRSGDTDYHVVVNGVEVFGESLAPRSSTGFTNSFELKPGDTVDFMVGRGADGLLYGSGLKIQASLGYLGLGGADLVAHWRFDETSGNTAHDLTGIYDGQLSATGATFSSGGASGGGVHFDSAQNGMMVAPPINGLVTDDFSVVTWAKLPAGDTTPFTWLFSLHEAWYTNGLLLLLNEYSPGQQYSAPGKASLIVNDGYHSLTSQASVNDGKWHQIAFTYQKNGVTSMYVDGQPSGSVASQPMIIDRSAPVVIGGLYGNVTTGIAQGYYTGWVDDVQVYEGALTAGQVDQLFSHPGKNLPELDRSLVVWPKSGTYTNSVNVSMATSTTGGVIRYTLDGSEPMASSLEYTGNLNLDRSTKVKARVFVNGNPVSEVISSSYVLPSNAALVAHWRFDETAGAVAHDLTGQYDGQVSPGGAEFVKEGAVGGGIHLDRASDGMVVAPPIPGLVTNDFSVVTWAKLPAGDTTPFTWLFSLHEACFTNGLLLLLNEYSPGQEYSAPGKASLIINDGYHSLTSKASINDGKWHQIAFTYEKNGLTSMYVDGQPSGSVESQATITDRFAPVVIGGLYGSVTTGVAKGYYTGWIDEIQVYGGALTEGEVGELYARAGKNLTEILLPLAIWPKSGTYTNVVRVSMTSAAPGGGIRYTTDGSEPTATSPLYTGELLLTNSVGVKARVFLAGQPISGVVSTTYSVAAAGPLITVQPEDQVVKLGEDARFVVSATGKAPLVYQWSKDGKVISGATNATLTLTGCTKGNEGSYAVVVSDATGKTTSSLAMLTVKVWQLSVRLYPGLLVEGTKGDRFTIQYVTELDPTSAWRDLATITLTNNFSFWFDMEGVRQQRIYRAVPLP